MQLDIPAATTAQGEKDRMSIKQSSPPISSHPAFPAAVALWFALLLGLGFFVLPASALESMVAATGIAAILPAAEPPLGATARLAISGLAALVGVALGLFIAWRVVMSQPGRFADDEGARATATLRAAHASLATPDDEIEQDDAPQFIRDAEADETGPAVEAEQADKTSDWKSWSEELGSESFDDLADETFENDNGDNHEPVEIALPAPAETKSGDEPQDDDHRQAADMLVAGLPRIAREELDDEPIAAWLREAIDNAEVAKSGDHGDPQDTAGPDAPSLDQAPTTLPPLADPTADAGKPYAPLEAEENFASFSLDQMVGRLGRAMANYEAVRAEQESADYDPAPQVEASPRAEVIDFQRRDRPLRGADIDRTANPPEAEPQQSLREALEKLTRVSSQS